MLALNHWAREMNFYGQLPHLDSYTHHVLYPSCCSDHDCQWQEDSSHLLMKNEGTRTQIGLISQQHVVEDLDLYSSNLEPMVLRVQQCPWLGNECCNPTVVLNVLV